MKYIQRKIKSKKVELVPYKKEPNKKREVIIYEHEFTNNQGKPVSKKILEKLPIKRIPPAYPDAIIDLEDEKIFAKCKDTEGRSQFIYHSGVQEKKNFEKYCELKSSIHKFQKLIDLVKKNKNHKKFTQERAITVLLLLMFQCHFRIGNDKFEKKYGSFGLTTLHPEHFKIKNNKMIIEFTGKKGVLNTCDIKNKNLMNNLVDFLNFSKNTNNDYVFIYQKDNKIHKLTSTIVNKFLKKNVGIRAKDLRTYYANLIFLQEVLEHPELNNFEGMKETARKKFVRECLEKTAEKLHHTVSICKNSYIFPPIVTDLIENSGKNFFSYKSIDPLNIFEKYLKGHC